MKHNSIYIAMFSAAIADFVLAIILMFVTSTKETARRHHRYARDQYGRVTCEYCKELMKGASHEQH